MLSAPPCATRCGCGKYWPRFSATLTSTRHRDSPVDVSARRAGHHVEIRVRDYGPGIPEHLALAVFEPFRRLGRGTVPGTGLGLYIARQLTQAMSGQIWVSDAHPGAEFHILIPRDPE
jgi:signal transduction histidine kinase